MNHSSQGSNEYGDQSGMMGYSYSSDSTKMCFNAPKNRQLGLYSDKTIRVTSGWSGRLYGLSSYKSAGTNDAVILYIPEGTNGFEDELHAEQHVLVPDEESIPRPVEKNRPTVQSSSQR